MPVVSPPSVTALPTPPSTASPSTFDSRADAFLGALPAFQTQMDALADNVFDNATDAATSATTATTQAGTATTQASAAAASAVAAGLSAGATAWNAATAYTLGQRAIDPSNGRVYRRLVAGTTGTQPNADSTNWGLLDADPVVVVVSGTSAAMVAFTHYVFTNVAATTGTLPASPAANDSVWVTWTNTLATNVIARNAQTIMGVAEDMTLDAVTNGTVQLRFVNSSWRLV